MWKDATGIDGPMPGAPHGEGGGAAAPTTIRLMVLGGGLGTDFPEGLIVLGYLGSLRWQKISLLQQGNYAAPLHGGRRA